MVKFYIPLHTAAINFKKQFLSKLVLLSAAIALQTTVHAQCTPPPAPVVTPNPAVVCSNNGPIRLVVQPTTTSQFCSGPVNIAVPDNNVAGASSSIAVSGLPLNCTITGLAVTINMTHTWVGDMVFVLKAPNGNVINLDYFLSGTGATGTGTGNTTGFVNTVISSTATTALSGGTNPWTGTFKPDMAGATFYPPAGPTGYYPTTITWSSLYSVPNSNWTLAFYDGVTGETGTLNSWCLNFTYTCANISVAAPAIWSPAAGLYLDPACAVPYVPGTPTDTVYARPFPPGTYTYQVTHNSLSTPPCTSLPTAVTVTSTVINPITTQPANQKVCLGNDAQFSVAATGTGLTYQWQVSLDGGATYANIVNAGVYSGATTASLTITKPPLSMNGLRYRVFVNGSSTCAAVLSNPALLTVNAKPTISFYSHPYHLLLPGLSTTLTSVLTPPNSAASYAWWYNGAVLPGATADTLLVDFAHIGLYQVSVTDTNGCTNISDSASIRDSTLGKMFIYPNPAGGQFQVRYYSESNTPTPRTLNLYNNNGVKILTKAYTQTISYQRVDIDIRRNGKGMYWVELLDKNGKRISIKKVMVQ